MKEYLIRLFSFAILFSLAVSMIPANASGVTITVNTPTNAEADAADSAGYATTTIYWQSTGNYSNTNTITLTAAWSGSGAPSTTQQTLKNCTPASTTAFGAAGSYSFGAGTATWTFSADVTGPKTGGLCVKVPVTTNTAGTLTTQNFSEAILTSGTTVDYGAAMVYVNGGNDVTVTATVPATLSFMITDPASLTTEKHTCALGTLTTAAVASCSYRLKIQTNAKSGYTAQVDTDHAFATGYATMTDIGAGGTVTAGTEDYGVAMTVASSGGRDPATFLFDQPAVAQAGFAANDFPLPLTFTNFVAYTGPFVVTSTTAFIQTNLVTHKAAISGGTGAGNYVQHVTYRVTGSF